ncbi:MAG: DUF1385 domain-containing protein, partial [Myxococcota bacterium]
ILAESVYNGMQALNFAADQAVATSENDAPSLSRNGETSPAASPADGRQTGKTAQQSTAEPASASSSGNNVLTIAASFALAIGLFVGLPHLLAWGTGQVAGTGTDVDSFGFHVTDGIFKLAIFVGYIAVISMIPEIRRVFQYHGAEHKVVNVYENGLPVTLDNARRFTTFHARCGTSFVLFVLVLSIFMFAAIFPLIPKVSDVTLINHVAMIFIKVPLMFPLSGIAYEINRYAARHPNQWWVQLLVGPGRLMQRLTTREPDDDQLEIAIAAMRAALRREVALSNEAPAASPQPSGQVAVFRDFEDVVDQLPDAAAGLPSAGLPAAAH